MTDYCKDILHPGHYLKYDVDNEEWYLYQLYCPERGWTLLDEDESIFIERDVETHIVVPLNDNEIKEMFLKLL